MLVMFFIINCELYVFGEKKGLLQCKNYVILDKVVISLLTKTRSNA